MVKIISLLMLTVFATSACAQEFEVLFDSDEEGVSCYRIPAITVAPNGDLIVAIDERVPSCADLRGSGDINIVVRRSTDDGKTWLPTERVVDFAEGYSASDPSFIVDKTTSEIYLFYNYMDLIKEKNIYYFQYVKSSDNGKTWGDPVDITSPMRPSEMHNDFMFVTSGQGTQTSDGTLLHTLVHVRDGVFVFGSEDHGKSWKIFGEMMNPGDESKIIILDDGSWMVNCRSNKAGLRYVHTSTDKGETWATYGDSSLVDASCNAAIINAGDGVLYFTNANHPSERKNLTLKKSTDSGKTWDSGQVIYEGGAAYSDLVELRDGTLGIVFEKDDYGEAAFVKVKVRW